jgi:hypothetical protein
MRKFGLLASNWTLQTTVWGFVTVEKEFGDIGREI